MDSAKTAFATALSTADKMALKEPLPGKPDGYKDATSREVQCPQHCRGYFQSKGTRIIVA
jgi:hypothetical protein